MTAQIEITNRFCYKKILNHAKCLIDRNKYILGSAVKPEEVVSEVFLRLSEKVNDTEKLARDIVLTEVRRVMANRQKRISRHNIIHKKCNNCNETKETTEFYKRYDCRTGLHYFDSYCKPCEIQRRLKYVSKIGRQEHNERRRERYKNDTRAKVLAHKRYLKYKSKKNYDKPNT